MRRKPFRGYCAAGCGNPVFSRRETAKYCSSACSNVRFRKWTIRRPCASCGKTVSLARQTYCSLKCHQDVLFRKRVEHLENGDYFGISCNSLIRRYLSERFGERCSSCGWDKRHPKTDRVPVEVEHIDGDWRNNRVENLTLLCPNCHSLTATFRGLNRGRGRPQRLGGRENPLPPSGQSKDSETPQPK